MQEKDSAKEYLNQLKIIDVCLKQKQDELAELRSFAESIPVVSNSERVQTSKRTDKMAETVVRIVCMEDEICSELENFTRSKHKIINEIQSLKDDTYISILFKRYVEYKTLEQIAIEMNYSYDRTKHLHGFALKCFKTQHL